MIEADDISTYFEVIQKLYSTKSLKEKEGEKVLEDTKYIANNWNACYLRLKLKDNICGCSAEAHIRHVLARRMSSRPMAWSELGSGNMVQLIAYQKNKKCLHELIAYQKFLKHEESKKYYKPEKLKSQAILTSDQTKQKYMDVFSVVTLPAKTNRNWLEKDNIIF